MDLKQSGTVELLCHRVVEAATTTTTNVKVAVNVCRASNQIGLPRNYTVLS